MVTGDGVWVRKREQQQKGHFKPAMRVGFIAKSFAQFQSHGQSCAAPRQHHRLCSGGLQCVDLTPLLEKPVSCHKFFGKLNVRLGSSSRGGAPIEAFQGGLCIGCETSLGTGNDSSENYWCLTRPSVSASALLRFGIHHGLSYSVIFDSTMP